MSANHTEREIVARALDHDCPDCGASRGTRCRILTPNRTTPGRTKVDVRKKPCPERAALVWQEMLREMRAAAA